MQQETLQSVSGLRRLPTESMSLAVLCLQSLVLSADDFYFQSRKSQSFQPLVPTYDFNMATQTSNMYSLEGVDRLS